MHNILAKTLKKYTFGLVNMKCD